MPFLQSEQRHSQRRSEGASNDDSEVAGEGDADDGDGQYDDDDDDDSGESQVLPAGDASDGEVVDVVTEEACNEDEASDEVWMSEKRHSGDGEVLCPTSSSTCQHSYHFNMSLMML